MDYNVSFETGTSKTASKLSSAQLTIERDKNDKGFTSLKKGQQITGMVVAVDNQVTLNFGGQKVMTSKDVMKNAVLGEMKTFEVIKASDSEIELRLLDEMAKNNRQILKATMVKESGWDTILSQREEAAKQAEKEKEAQETKDKLEEISSKFTQRDCQLLENEGFAIESMTISGLYNALNRVKASVADKEQKETGKMTSFGEEEIAARLKSENLPITTENLGKITKALELSDTATKLDDKTMQYLISSEAEPTIENIYKAYYSGNAVKQEQQPLSKAAWSELETQVKDVIGAAGYEVNEENLTDARWLIENKLPLTTETFQYKKELDDIASVVDKDLVLDKIITGMKNGTTPMEVSLALQEVTSPEQVLNDVNSIQDETITQAVKQDLELTIKRLMTLQESIASKSNTEEIKGSEGNAAIANATAEEALAELTAESSEEVTTSEKDYRYEEIKAQRQMEEIRLKMTLEAAAKLEQKGISIETQRLEKVVEALRELEDNYYKELLSEAEVESSELSLQTLKETTESLEKLKFIPSSVLASTLSESSLQTIPSLLSEGMKLQAELTKAGAAYETLMTVPNSEYGDSIRKAFANMDSLLSEMNIENTQQNQRAVRILGYNQMEITEESINRVKAYDQEVTTMMQNLHPAVTVRMIKEGINPLNMTITELNTTIDSIKEEHGISSEEKFSTYLRNLEKEEGITPEERKAYIGIYRLLYNVEKSDGAALGSVIKADQEVTLDNLLTAVQTSKKGRLDAVINDEFGTLQSISHEKETIAEQLSAFSGGAGQQNSSQTSDEDAMAKQTEYLDRILKQIKEELSPDKLQEAQQKALQTETLTGAQTGAQTAAQVAALAEQGQVLSSGQNIWETMKDVPVEKLLEQLRSAEGMQQTEEEAYAGKVQEIRELCKNSEQSIRFLNDYRVPSTPLNIMLANQVLSNGDSSIKKLLKGQNENIVENTENSLKEMSELSDTLIDKSSMNEAYEKLEANAKATLDRACSEEKIDGRKLAELKNIGQQMTFLRTLAGKEFYQIPIETDKGITNMNLTILRGTETSGKVSVTIWSEQLGNIKADFSLKEQTLKGFISCDNRNGLEEHR